MGVAEQARAYVNNRVYLKKAVAEDVVNYAALARLVAEAIDIDGQQGTKAVEVALRRMKPTVKAQKAQQILAQTTYTMYADAAVLRDIETDLVERVETKATQDNALYTKISTEKSLTVITVSSVLPDSLSDYDGVTAFKLSSPSVIESSPGVIALLTDRLRDASVNIVELFSCQDETVFAVSRDDVSTTIQCLEAYK